MAAADSVISIWSSSFDAPWNCSTSLVSGREVFVQHARLSGMPCWTLSLFVEIAFSEPSTNICGGAPARSPARYRLVGYDHGRCCGPAPSPPDEKLIPSTPL